MSATIRLPPALLDLTLVRASARLHFLSSTHAKGPHVPSAPSRRWYAHQSVAFARLPTPPAYTFSDGGESDQSFYNGRQRRSKEEAVVRAEDTPMARPMSELARRVQALEVAAEEESALDPPTYSESDLLTIYEDLLALPPENVSVINADAIDEEAQEQEDISLLNGVAHRLLGDADALDAASQYHAVMTRLQKIVAALHTVRLSAGFIPTEDQGEASILTNKEWSSLVRACVRAEDSSAAEIVLDLMKRSGTPAVEECFDDILAFYARRGDVADTERFLHTVIGGTPTERQRDLHIKAHIKSLPPHTFPTTALEHLHAYEVRELAAPQRTYTRTIAALLSTRSGVGPAHAWDLFAHMRYAAHPVPDAALYTLMISACADPRDPQPERALDLFAEMTLDQGIAPTVETYAAAALACGRSGQRRYVNEAYRLAKEMLDANRDAYGRSAFRPNMRLFNALLEGAKRVGDLARVRWLLAEMVKESVQDGADVEVNDSVMMHVFHTYASYRPPFRRGATVLLDKQAADASQPPAEPAQQATGHGDEEGAPEATDPDIQVTEAQSSPTSDTNASHDDAHAGPPEESSSPRFSHLPPQTPVDVIREAKALFARIHRTGPHDHSAARPFRNVQLTPHLLNAYLAVYSSHTPFHVWGALYRTLSAELSVPRDAYSYVYALESCATVRERTDRADALVLADEVWAEWERVERAWRAGADSAAARTVNARLVERAHAAMIRLLCLTQHVQRALAHVRAFADAYPPGLLKAVPPKAALRSSRTVLHGARPLVRLTSAVGVPDDAVPPLLTFADVRLLHQCLVAAGDRAGLRYLGWVCKAYEGSLRRRREAVLRAVPGADGDVPQAGGAR
ncbi:hypothetical protein B0H21DRAFT_779635 [Amylocystis lapponica]|nr:hypothetical protein B0H21DRAFT_779635 [Amylocystis lapponica]